MKKFFVLLMVGSVLITGCKNGCNKKGSGQPGEDSTTYDIGERADSLVTVTQPDSAQIRLSKDSVLTSLTKEVLTIFKDKQYAKLDSLIHPEEGVRFSPYATVSGEDRKFSREEFNTLVTTNKNKKVNWGSFDGSGDPISLTAAEYFKKFVYDANFVAPEKYDINNFIETGNSINNLKSKYEGSDFTESHFPGSKKNGGIDWKSVRLVFKEIGGKYYLVGVVHDQWTI
ncbi:hypothetical protein [Niabella hibiscisoli]|uniref:hypothetical protein n=1 Tax=Niabella hibiscisoli TaxID=1825928 RepID=UPI001F106839|nr:hypothetical protein [Niabella hibiscisoli]MCH5716611.1 hypothetical protein [Niabella hibiscisoli]